MVTESFAVGSADSYGSTYQLPAEQFQWKRHPSPTRRQVAGAGAAGPGAAEAGAELEDVAEAVQK